jgi:hypothetical protein
VSTVTDLLNAAAKALGKFPSGGGLRPTELSDGLIVVNNLVDYFTARKAFVYTTRQDEYTFTDKNPPDGNNPAVYTLGPSGADFTGPRPTRIERANILLTDASPGVFFPLEVLDVDQWAQITLEQMPVTLPTKMYPDYANPNCNLYFWGQPTAPYILQLFTWQQIGAFVGVNTTIAANVATGSHTVTPASMAGIVPGVSLTVANSDGSHSETVLVTATTATSFTATFATTKTGPGVAVSVSALSQTIIVPPGYYFAFLYTAAELLGPQWKCEVPEIVTRMARNGRAAIAGMNSRSFKLQTRDAGMPGGHRGELFNYRSRSY